MKNMGKIFLNLLMILFLTSCKDSSTSVNTGVTTNISITLNGSGYVNNSYSMTSLSSEAVYDTSFKATNCKFSGGTSDLFQEINLSFGSYRPGFYYWHGASSLSIVLDSAQTIKTGRFWYSNSEGKTTVSAYGNIGELISGEFEGKVYALKIEGSDSISVKGVFSIKRTK